MYDRYFGNIFLHEFLCLSGVSIDQKYCLQSQIKTNQQNFTKVAVDNLMEKNKLGIHHVHKVV